MSIKYSIILLLAFFLLNCRNKKVEIVERQKAIKKERAELNKKLDSVIGLLYLQAFSKNPDTASLMNTLDLLKEKNNALTNEYDSLVTELKKY